ncbi:MAG: membrane complex biogenesis BtpA family protein, partial [Planctomycetota bacterium]
MRAPFGADATAPPTFVGVVHLLPLPGAPRHAGGFEPVLERARSDAAALCAGGCDALIVENFGDVPFFAGRVPAETVAAMTLAVAEVRRVAPHVLVGVNVLRNDARSALGICAASGAEFIRVNVHTGAAVTDQGLISGQAADTLRERARLAPGVKILADVHVKHATPMGSESLVQAAQDTLLRGLADALIVSGAATGEAPAGASVRTLRAAVDGPLLLGSGLDLERADEL